MLDPKVIIDTFADLSYGGVTGLGRWLSDNGMHVAVEERLSRLDEEPLSKVQLNQLLVISGLPSISDGFYQYYWLEKPKHVYDLDNLTEVSSSWFSNGSNNVVDLKHLKWGLYRIYVDSLLYFGNISAGFKYLRGLEYKQICDFFKAKCFDTPAIAKRGPSLKLRDIARDDRYLISEMACKSYGSLPSGEASLKKVLVDAWRHHKQQKGGAIPIRGLLDGSFIREHYSSQQLQFQFSADDLLDIVVSSEEDILRHYQDVSVKFESARQAALYNTELYLSVVNDLDVYVATSMRNRNDFRQMAYNCERIFRHPSLKDLYLRYFDPTMSAAEGHEDKGLIECLMVKCAKVLVYTAGIKESYGKDAEAAMALSLGKPVIFLCDAQQKANFYKEVHPLSRLIDFRSGVAVGAIVTDNWEEVVELLYRIFHNAMIYTLERHAERDGFLRLSDQLTGSVVRVQTDNDLLTKTFWNNYHNREPRLMRSLAAGKEAERLQE